MTLIKCVVVCHELGQMAPFKAKSETDYLFPTSNWEKYCPFVGRLNWRILRPRA